MAHQKLKVCGTLEGWIHNFFEEPTYKNEPCDFRLKIRVTEDADELREILRDNYNKLCDWYRKTSGNRRFFAEPWIENEDGSVTVRVTAKPKYQEFPFPVVD